MRIKRLEIYGYGKWIDTVFDVNENMHVFFGLNEAGKSTLMSFIHSILFGFPTRNSTLLRYEPRESSRYGGKIIGTDSRFGEVIIERIHGKVTGDVTVTIEDGTTGTDELLDSVLHGMTRESFQNIFSFNLTDIENVHKLNKNQLSRYLLTIGAHGTEYYLELVDQFQADADKIYRPSGRVLALNKQLSILEKQEQKLVDLEKENAGYLSLIEQLNEENKTIETLEKKEKTIEKKVEDIKDYKKQLHIFEEIKALDAEIKEITLPPLKEDGKYLLDEYKREKVNLNEQLQTIQLKTNEMSQTFEQPELMTAYMEHKEAFNQLENQLPEMMEQLHKYETLSEKRASLQKELLTLEDALQITNQPVYPTRFSEPEVANIYQWNEKLASQLEKQDKLQQHIQETESELNVKNQKLDQMEDLMWDNQTFKEAKAELESSTEKPKNKTIPIILSVVGIALIILTFVLPSPLNWIAGLFGLAAFVGVVFTAKPKQRVHSNDFLEKEFERQVRLKEEWQDSLGEVDALQAQMQSLMTQKDQASEAVERENRQWQTFLSQHQLPITFNQVDAPTLINQVNQLHDLVTKDEELTSQQNAVKQELEEESALISKVMPHDKNRPIPEKIKAFRVYLAEIKSVITKEEEKLEQLNAFKQDEKRVKSSLDNNQTKIQTLLETADVKSEADFIQLYQTKEKRDAKINRRAFLMENAPDYDANKELPSSESLEQKMVSFHKELNELEELKNQAIREMTNTKLSIEQLEKDGTYTEELQLFENEKATTQRLVDEWVSDKLAAGIIKSTLNQVTKDRFVEIMADAEQYFCLLTDGEYERIVFNEDELFVQMRNGQVVDVRVLSRGTAEPLYVAIRLAYIKNTQDMMELPVIMDDPFVNFDEQRRKNMMQVLNELSADLQIIYFTFDETAVEYFADEQMTNLEMRT